MTVAAASDKEKLETDLDESLVFDATDPTNMIVFTDPMGAKVQSPLHGDIDGETQQARRVRVIVMTV